MSSVLQLRPARMKRTPRWCARLRPLALILALALMLAGQAVPARAQADPCPEPNNGYNQACFIGPGTPVVHGFIGQPGDVDAFKFDVPTTLARVRIELRDLPADYDLHLFDNAAAFITEAVTQGTGTEVIDLPLVGGTYFVFVNSGVGQSNAGSPYTLEVRVDPFAASPGLAGDACPEPNNALGSACALTPSRLAFGAIADADDVDTYRFEVRESSSLVTARLGDDAAEDVVFALLDANGKMLDHGPVTSTLFQRLDAGTYFVEISREDEDLPPSPYALLVTITAPSVAPAAGRDDVCPEPNDQYDRACTIGTGGPALGYISSPSDIDIYRFEVPRARSWVHIELTDLPKSYDLEVQDGEHNSVASSHNSDTFPDVLDLDLDPGPYFILIFSPLAQSDNDQSYKLTVSMQPLSSGAAPAASVLFADNFNNPGAHFSRDASDDTHEVGYYDGEYTIKLHSSGDPSHIEDQGQLAGIDLRDFQLDLDVRVTEPAATCGGFVVNFRWQDDSSGYELYVDTVNRGKQGSASLSRFTGGANNDLSDWVELGAIRTGNQSNHVTIRAAGSSLAVAINGQPILRATDDRFKSGDIGLGAFTCDRPTEARFDNVIATPTR